MFATHTTVILTTFLLVLAYAILIARRLNQSRYLRTTPFPSHEELLEASENWAAIDVLDDERIKHSTGKRYLVTGASGQLGSCMVELLARRGEQYIYCLDATPLPLNLQNRDGVHHIKTDIRSSEEVNAAIEKARPDVVFHFCVVIRFWERASFTYRLSAAVNVDGTRHVMSALQRLTQSEKIFLHCSSPAVLLPAPLMFRLGWNFTGSEASFMLSDDRPISNQLATHSYAATKAVADKLVRMANGEGGLKTGVLRPGMGIQSPKDPFSGHFMRQQVNPFISRHIVHNNINVQDLAACFLLYETAMRERPTEVSGDAFLVTGDTELWTQDRIREVLQLFASRNLNYVYLPLFPLYFLGHVAEAFCYMRYYTLLPFYSALYGKTPSPHPRWMEKYRLQHLMPASYNTLCMDVGIDDTRARKILGYRNKWSNAQTQRWIAESVEAESGPKAAASQKGFEIPPEL